jgi:aspartyl-tRNA(Asn)/glutamyl-tRNA(Gln) amidotransferase subunit A
LTPLLRHLRDDLGATLVPISIPSITLSLPAYYVLACAEASSNLARYGGGWYGGSEEENLTNREDVRRWGFGEEVKKRILAGTHALTAEYVRERYTGTRSSLIGDSSSSAFNNSYLKALHLRHALRQDFDRVFRFAHPLKQLEPNTTCRTQAPSNGVDVLLHLTAVQTAPNLPLEANADSSEPIPEYAQDILTVPASLGGLPALSLPIGTGADGWPVGLSLVGQWGADRGVLAVAAAGIESFGRRKVDLS